MRNIQVLYGTFKEWFLSLEIQDNSIYKSDRLKYISHSTSPPTPKNSVVEKICSWVYDLMSPKNMIPLNWLGKWAEWRGFSILMSQLHTWRWVRFSVPDLSRVEKSNEKWKMVQRMKQFCTICFLSMSSTLLGSFQKCCKLAFQEVANIL